LPFFAGFLLQKCQTLKGTKLFKALLAQIGQNSRLPSRPHVTPVSLPHASDFPERFSRVALAQLSGP